MSASSIFILPSQLRLFKLNRDEKIYIYITQVISLLSVFVCAGITHLCNVKSKQGRKKRKSSQRRRGGQSVKRNTPLNQALKKLVRMKATPRRHALAHSNDVFIRQLSSAVKSVRKKQLPANVRRRLLKHRKVLRALANPHKSLGSKRKLTSQQKGGFFGSMLASLAAPIVGSLVNSITSSLRGN